MLADHAHVYRAPTDGGRDHRPIARPGLEFHVAETGSGRIHSACDVLIQWMTGLMSDDEFLRAVAEHLAVVVNLAHRLSRSRQQAEDLAQETWLRALRGWRRKRPDDVQAWLVTICLNTARDGYRHDKARPIEVLDPDVGIAAASALDTAEQALAMVVRDTVRQALRQLPPSQREAITLMDLYGFTAAEVAAMTGVPRGTVLARVCRGHRHLAVLLRQQSVASTDGAAIHQPDAIASG